MSTNRPRYGQVDREYGMRLATTPPDEDGPVVTLGESGGSRFPSELAVGRVGDHRDLLEHLKKLRVLLLFHQPGYLFLPFGDYRPEEIVKPKKKLAQNCKT